MLSSPIHADVREEFDSWNYTRDPHLLAAYTRMQTLLEAPENRRKASLDLADRPFEMLPILLFTEAYFARVRMAIHPALKWPDIFFH